MTSMELDGTDRDLERFAEDVLKRVAVEIVSPFERRMSWDMRGYAGFLNAASLRSGMQLSATRLRWDRATAIVIEHSPAPLEFVLSRGPGPRVTQDDGVSYVLGAGMFHVGQVKRPLRLHCDFGDTYAGEYQEHICLNIDRGRLSELLGTNVLPAAIERILENPGAYPRDACQATPGLFRLLDEIVYSEGRGVSRQLYLEAKGLELLALMIDELEENERSASPLLSRYDIERLERARQILLARMQDPPNLPELARAAGLNEAKLKAGFRTLFGSPVYSYLRNHRMEAAHRLLRERGYAVTEVAQRVGYANPSKFAAAFRKRFGMSPSDVA